MRVWVALLLMLLGGFIGGLISLVTCTAIINILGLSFWTTYLLVFLLMVPPGLVFGYWLSIKTEKPMIKIPKEWLGDDIDINVIGNPKPKNNKEKPAD